MKPVIGHTSWIHSRGAVDERTVLRAGATLIATTAIVAALYSVLPHEIALPVIASGCFALAALAALAAALRRRAAPNRITLWDIAGALTLIGIFASALIAPEQLVQIIEGNGQRK